ncbi:MAG: GNAT family N-acetyltransferase [Acidobacteriota bacterium]|nr:GNAT family N-acetyltransferase [Acidobacteriota bacterium]
MLNIKKAGLADLRELQAIGIDSYLPHYAHLWKENNAEWYLNKCFGDEFLQNELADANIEYYIISAEEKNIGILKLVLRKPLPDSDIENALYLEKIYFIKEWTGKGVGRELINFTFERAGELNRECVWLVAMDTADKPVKAYERTGFTIHSRSRIDFEWMKDEFRGTLVMKKCFKTNEN